MRVIIERGVYADYARLAHLHYRAGRPATIAGVWRAVVVGPPLMRGTREVVGVLVVSMPVLNAGWRARAWPALAARLARAGARSRARILNSAAGVRCISRVIVDPRARGLGLARRLVRAYLREPLARHTEAIAALDQITPFFARAGMRGIDRAPAARDQRLHARMRAAGVAARALVCATRLRQALRRCPRLRGDLRAWARASKATASAARGPLAALAARAASSGAASRRVWVARARRPL